MVDFQERLASFGGSRLTELRPAQLAALSAYGEMRPTHPDIGIELPTGAGKTLIALLIADLALDEGMSVAYLTGTKQLADQVLAQAIDLPGLDVVQFTGQNYPAAQLLAYHQAQAVAVMNYWVYFNTNPRVDPADLIIFDDAHLAEQAISGMYTLRIPRESAGGTNLYQEICDFVLQVSPDLYPTLKALRDGTAPRNSPPELLSFVDWATVLDSVYSAIEGSEFLAHDNSAGFVWRTIRHNLNRCGILVGPSAIEIRPYHVPTQTINGYARSRSRLYLSATLGQPGDIQRRLGTNIVTTVPSVESDPQRLGKRTFLINPTLDDTLADSTWQFALRQVEAASADSDGRVAWLCASNTEADEIERRLSDAGYAVFRLRAGEDQAVDRWRTTDFAHLVTAGRFDGLDFADDVCRLVFIPSVPAASSEFERFVVAYLGDAAYMRYRIGQRVTQALGRANRTPTDSALYVGLDPGFGAILADPAVQAALGEDIQPIVAEGLQLHGQSWQFVDAAAHQFWATHREPVGPAGTAAVPRRPRPGRRIGGVAQVDSAPMEVNATTRMWLGDADGASNSASDAANLLQAAGELEHAAFWKYIQAHALYDRGGERDASAAREALEEAIASAPLTAWFVRLRRTVDRIRGIVSAGETNDSLFLAWDEWIREAGSRLPIHIATARQQLQGSHDQRCEALLVLGRLCGVSASRPAGSSATDARWTWATKRYGQRRVWEVKTGGPTRVPRVDINQLLGQVQEEQNLNPLSRVTGCLLTEHDEIEDDAGRAANSELVLVTLDAAVALFEAMAERFTAYQTASGSGTAVERGAGRQQVEARLPTGEWLNALLSPKGTSFLRRVDIDSLFNS